MKRKLSLLFFAAFIIFIFGCGGSTPEQGLIRKVNADDKNFRGEWVYRSQLGGQFAHLPVRTRIRIEVSGRKFHLVGEWGEANPPDERRTEGWVYDGKVLWQLIPSQRQADYLKIKGFKGGPFWKMPPRMEPFPPPKETGKEEVIAGRICRVLQIRGKYDQGDVTLTYWIDKEKNLLLKKEHLLEAGGLTLFHEVYECESIEFDPVFPEGTFDVNIPSDWVKVKKRYLDCELLTTKF